jgi:hypothetical protein
MLSGDTRSTFPSVPFFTPSSRSFFRNMMRSPLAKSRAPRSADIRTSCPSSPASRSRSRAAWFKSRTSALVWVRMIRLLSGSARRCASHVSISSARAASRVSAAWTMPWLE